MINQLKTISFFHDLDKKTLSNLIENKEIIQYSYSKGMTVYEQYSDCNGMDIVVHGKLIAYSLSSSGSETVLFEFNKGSVIGANLLFGDQIKYPMNIYSSTDSNLIHISKSAVIELLKDYNFVRKFVKSLSLNSQGMNKKIAMYTQKSLKENLMDYFTALSSEQGSRIINLPTTKKQLADYFGVQRPSLFRELKRMRDEDLIEIKNRIIKLHYLDKI